MRLRSALLLVWLGVPLARAQVAEVSLSFGTSLFRNNDLGFSDPVRFSVNDGFRISARFTLNTYRFFGHEFGYGYTRSRLKAPGYDVGMPTHQGVYNFLAYAFPEGSPVRPFAAGGGHFSTFYPPGTSASYGNGVTKFGVNYGGGIKIKVSPIFGLRFDVRDYVTPKPFGDFLTDRKGPLHQIEASAGLGLVF